MNLQIPIK